MTAPYWPFPLSASSAQDLEQMMLQKRPECYLTVTHCRERGSHQKNNTFLEWQVKKKGWGENLSVLPLLRPTLEREEKLLWELIWPQCQPVVHVQIGKCTARRHNASQQPNYKDI